MTTRRHLARTASRLLSGALLLPLVAAPAAAQVAVQKDAAPAAAGATSRAEPVTVQVPAGTLHGTLQLPAGATGRVPVALIIAGSGPTDRDGNSPLFAGKNNSLRMLAEGLAARGIASVRYDKRGLGGSAAVAAREADVTFADFAGDAAAWLRHLRADPRFSTVTVIGHSEGSLLALLAASEVPVDGVVSLAGSGQPLQQVVRAQLRPQLPAGLYAQADTILMRLERGERVDSVPPVLTSLFRPSVQPFLIDAFRHDPARLVAQLQVPVLIAQGTTDVQVPVSEAERLRAARPAATLLLVEGMNHVLKLVDGPLAAQLPSYGDPSLPVAPALVEGIASFVTGLSPAGR